MPAQTAWQLHVSKSSNRKGHKKSRRGRKRKRKQHFRSLRLLKVNKKQDRIRHDTVPWENTERETKKERNGGQEPAHPCTHAAHERTAVLYGMHFFFKRKKKPYRAPPVSPDIYVIEGFSTPSIYHISETGPSRHCSNNKPPVPPGDYLHPFLSLSCLPTDGGGGQ